MRVFVCYSHQDADFAESIAIRLRAAKHDVFFDRSKLEPGMDFDRRIREFLEHADLLIFLASPDALAANAYAQTELEIFKRRFPLPKDRVLTVMRPGAQINALPSYLRAVSVFEPRGDATAHVTDATLRALHKLGRPRRQVLFASAAGVAILGIVAVVQWAGGSVQAHFAVVNASLSQLKDASPSNEGEFLVRATFALSAPSKGQEKLSVEFDPPEFRAREVESKIESGAAPDQRTLLAFITILDINQSRQIHSLEALGDVRWRLVCAPAGDESNTLNSDWEPVTPETFEPARLTTLPAGNAAAAEFKAALKDKAMTVLLVVGDGAEQEKIVRRAVELQPWQKVIWCKQPLDLKSELKELWGSRTFVAPNVLACTISSNGTLADVIKVTDDVSFLRIQTALTKADEG